MQIIQQSLFLTVFKFSWEVEIGTATQIMIIQGEYKCLNLGTKRVLSMFRGIR